MDQSQVAEILTARLNLATPPVALAFVEAAPPGMEIFVRQVPSACTLWREAESRVFFAPPEAHFNCPIGAMTMGFEMPPEVQEQLSGFVEKMCGCNYVSADEPAKIPSVTKKKAGIVYGPLEIFPIPADLVLLWLSPRQAMFYGEAIGSCRWTEEVPTGVFGRPACAALPVVMERSDAASSFGCMGMRTFTEISDDLMFVALPGNRLTEFVSSLDATVAANEEMRQFYEGHKARFTTESPAGFSG